MGVTKLYKKDYDETRELHDDYSKYEWAASHVFGLTTYDGSLDELFVKKIIEVCKAILDRTTFEYIKDENNYVTYIIVCQLLNSFNWIEWGTSIRGAWFEEQNYNQYKSRPISQFYAGNDTYEDVPFTEDNLKALIKFIEKE